MRRAGGRKRVRVHRNRWLDVIPWPNAANVAHAQPRYPRPRLWNVTSAASSAVQLGPTRPARIPDQISDRKQCSRSPLFYNRL